MKIIPVILSGGSGNRLWPLSRAQFPKQYLSLVGKNSMLQETMLRLNGIENLSQPIIVCNVDHRFIVAEQLKQIDVADATIILEPIARNTAPAIIASAIQSLQMKNSTDDILLILSADHFIQDTKAFYQSMSVALIHAGKGKIVTFGIVPTHANTGYGYIQAETTSDEYNSTVMNVKSFKEKPDKELADVYLLENDQSRNNNIALSWYWNSGMFVCQAKTLIDESSIHSSDILSKVRSSVENAIYDLDFIRLEEKTFASSPNMSIDYALMEKSKNVIVVPMDAKWIDVGSWSNLYDIGKKDSSNNLIKGDVVSLETTNSYINASHHLVATIGIDNLIVVGTSDAILIASRDKSQEVKKIVEKLQLMDRDEAHSNRKVYRPWGWYDSIDSGQGFQVKRISVNPGSKLSLQKHQHRSEHWVVINGIAQVTCGEKVFKLKENQSAYIPKGEIHRLENREKTPLEIIEIQTGDYLGEDDIIRLEDDYERN
jgi:mannose-1-phosphate guanylyltransferase/mannose-6-phosphate isomerase